MTGEALARLAPMTGRTERAIITETLALNGMQPSEALLADLYSALGEAAREAQPRMRETGTALPGARQTIAALNELDTVQSLVTGNTRPIATVKLDAFGLTHGLDLTIGGYGDDGSDRADLVRKARGRAAARYGADFAAERTFVVGDTPHDIKGAHDAGAYAVGVATGSSPATALEEAGADLVLRDLTAPEPLLDAVRTTARDATSNSLR